MPNYVPGCGSITPSLMIVGEAPGRQENIQETPFVGPTGEMLNEFLFKAGIRRSECWLTNVVKYQPPLNDFTKLHLINVSLEDSIKSLWDDEIHKFRPNCVLAVGDVALNALTGLSGILNYRGSILLARDGVTKVVPTIHPAALFSHAASEEDQNSGKGGLSWVYTKLIEADIKRAAEESLTKKLDLPVRELKVAHSSLDLYRYFREYEGLADCAVDIESINCIPVCVGFAFNRHHAISVPLYSNIGKNKISDMGPRELRECWRLIDKKLYELSLIGQNFKYDEYKLRLSGFNVGKVKSDTLLKTRVIFPELPNKRLHVISSLWTREPYYKEEGKEFKLGKSNINQLLVYNARDCAVEKEIDEVQEEDLDVLGQTYNIPLRDYYYNYMMRKHSFYLKMENVGFNVDFERKAELKARYIEMENDVHAKLTNLIGHDINVKSYPNMFDLLYKEMKFKVLKKNPTSEDAIVRLMANHAKKPGHKEILELVLEERRIRDQKSRYINFTPDYDGRCKTTYNISATETCRSSTGILKKPIRPKKIGLAFHTISAHGRLAKDIKSMLIPDKGMVFIKADAGQAEARVVAVLSEDYELLEAFDTVDIHRRTAALILGYTQNLELSRNYSNIVVDSMEKDGPERFCGKKTRHAGNYNMGKGRFMLEFNTDAQKFEIPISISEWKAGQMVELFHAASPKIRGVFHRDVREAIQSTRCLIDPYGGLRIFYGRMDESLFMEAFANIPQRTVAHLVQGAALKIDDELNGDKAFIWMGEKHDELIMQVPENNIRPYAQLLRKHMEASIDFSTYCSLKRNYKLVIPCDIEISSTHYGKFEKFEAGIAA